MSFDKFLLAVESRDLSQADKSIIRVSCFLILQKFWMIKFTVIPKKLFGTWQFYFIIQKFARLKSKHFSQFFWWEVNLRRLRPFILQKVQASGLIDKKGSFTTHHSVWDRKHSFNTFVSLRQITWLKSQKKPVKAHVEHPSLS